jgi:uncharacterized protein (TIGR03083 family)
MAMLPRAEALEILRSSRSGTGALIEGLTEAQLTARTSLGGGNWSIKDLIGHLAGVEEVALAVITGKRPAYLTASFSSAKGFNDAEIERKRNWSLAKIRKDAERVRAALLKEIETMDDERWTSKIQIGTGRSALVLVLGRMLVGGRHGPFAHDLAHLYDLERSVRSLRG